MRLRKYNKGLGWLSLFASITLLSSCSSALLDPKGQIGLKQRSLILVAFGLILTVIIPAILMATGFTRKCRASNKDVKCGPSQSHSNRVEVVIWTVPILIIIFLAILTWKTTHALEPSKPLTHDGEPTTIGVVSMDWKWFFIYPEQDIATVSEIAFPASTPVCFKVTSNPVMNSFFVPCLGSQIYAMADMRTRLRLIANGLGAYDGISVNYSGPGFSGMKFKAIAAPDHVIFGQWVAGAKQSPNTVFGITTSEKLTASSEYNQVEYFPNVEPDLFADVINKFMTHGKNMNTTQLKGEHSTREGMEDMDMSRAEPAH